MCDPVSMTVMTIASTASSLYAQQQQANAQAAFNKRTYENQMTAYRYNQANNNYTRVQEAQNLAEQKLTNNNAAVRAMSRARAMAAQGGVEGLSVDALLADLGARAGNDNANAEVNYLRRDNAIQTQNFNSWAATSSAINKLETPKVPDYLGAALKIGTAYNSLSTAPGTAPYETQPWGGTTSNPWYG